MRQLRKFKLLSIYRQFGVLFVLSIWLHACANVAPVQEMSNARQTLKAAKAVNAEQLAPLEYKAAMTLLKSAENELAEKNYDQARASAIAARQQAIKARQEALGKQAKQP